MPSLRALPLTIALVALCSAPARALDPGKGLGACSVETWRAREGVTGVIRVITQTRDGYLWLATSTGLARYGGGPVVPIAGGPTQERAGDIVGLFPARTGTLWVLPARGPPLCVGPGQLELADCFSEAVKIDPGVRITALAEAANGAVWIASDAGLFRFLATGLTLAHPAAKLPGRITGLAVDDRDRLWIATTDGLFIRQPTNPPGAAAVVRHEAAGPGSLASLHTSPRKGLWLVSDAGLVHIDGDATRVFPSDWARSGRPVQIIEDRDGNVWAGARRGLTRWRRDQTLATFTRADGLPDDDVTAVFEDREGSLWVGTRGGGLAQFTDRTLDGQAGPPSLRDRWINTLAEDPTGALWVGTRTGLTRWQNERERTFTIADGLPSDNVLSVLPGAHPDELWVGTAAGLARWRNGRFEAAGLSEAASALYRDDKGRLWVGISDGVARLDDAGLVRLPPEPGAVLNEIRGLAHADDGTLWLSAGGRLMHVGADRVRTPADAPPIGKVRALTRAADGTLWLGTYEGLARLRAGRWHRFGAAEGFTPGDTFQVLDDGNGYLWAGTSEGILRVSKTSLDDVAAGRRRLAEVVRFHMSDQGHEVDAVRARQPSAWRGRNGQLWFATSRGVVKVDPARVRVNTLPPPAVIERLLVDGRPARRDANNDFPPGAGALEVHFGAITLLEPQKALHRYRLDGFDRDWVYAGPRRVAYYTNLPPGQYQFRVAASNADGVWNETGDALAFRLAPHFYQTWWSYAAAILAGAGLIVAFHRARVARLADAYAATMAERTRVARELHDSLLQGLAGAQLQLTGLRKQLGRGAAPQGEKVGGALDAIAGSIGATIAETRQFVWGLREPATGSLEASLAELVRRKRQEGAPELHLRTTGTPRSLPPHVQQETLRIVEEALANAHKHAEATRIDLDVAYATASIRLSVRDDGRGFNLEEAPGPTAGHFGLAGMRERATVVGFLTVTSRPGHGTDVTIVINETELRGDDG